jgi:hypothetical protein
VSLGLAACLLDWWTQLIWLLLKGAYGSAGTGTMGANGTMRRQNTAPNDGKAKSYVGPRLTVRHLANIRELDRLPDCFALPTGVFQSWQTPSSSGKRESLFLAVKAANGDYRVK